MTLLTWIFIFPSWVHQLWIESAFWTLVLVFPYFLTLITMHIFKKYFDI